MPPLSSHTHYYLYQDNAKYTQPNRVCLSVTITGTDDLSARLCVCHIHIFRVMACLACHNSKTTCNFEGPSGSACVRCQRIGLCCISHAWPRVHACPRVPKSEHSKKRAHPLFGPFWAPTSDPVGRVAVADVGGNDVVG